MDNLGKILKHIRVFNHYGQQALADEFKIDRSYVSTIESGRARPSQALLIKYSEFADIPLSAIMLFAEEFDDKSTLRKKAKSLVTKSTIGFLDWICRD